MTPIILMTGLTIVAFMIAINTHGRLRTGISYALATALLGLTTVIYFNHAGALFDKGFRHDRMPSELVEKGIDDRQPARRSDADVLSPADRGRIIAELRKLSAEGTACANSLLNKELKDESVELETLVGRASETRRRVEFIKTQFEKTSAPEPFFRKPVASIKAGIQLLSEAAQLYLQYYYAEDSTQETMREKLLRQKAKEANEEFQRAANELSNIK